MDIKFGLIIPAILSLFILKKYPLISITNISLVFINFSLIAGTIMLPYSIDLDRFHVADPALYAASISKSVIFAIITSSVITLPILILGARSKGKINIPGIGKINSLLTEIETIPPQKAFKVLLVFIMVGCSLIWFVFLRTGNIPYVNIDASAKYFNEFTAQYIPLRPFYVLGQQTLAISGLIALLYILRTPPGRSTLFLVSLLLFSTVTLLLTLKRGETFYPFTTLIGALIVSKRINKRSMLFIVLTLFAVFYMAMLTDPKHINKPFSDEIRQVFHHQTNVTGIQNADASDIRHSGIFSVSRRQFVAFMASTFGIRVRESARLIYNFRLKGLPYLHGKTFLAGILGFMPTEYFKFKEKYQIGRVTLDIFGNNKETAGGPRIGLHGEAYINFGYPGVFILPAILGAAIWFLNEIHLNVLNRNAEAGIFLMAILFFVMQHLILGVFSDGSGAIQTFIIRAGIMAVIFSFLLYGNSPVRGVGQS